MDFTLSSLNERHCEMSLKTLIDLSCEGNTAPLFDAIAILLFHENPPLPQRENSEWRRT